MTLPWKTWTRSLLPSITLTCTLTSSPGPNSGRSERRYWLSTRSVDFMARSFVNVDSGPWQGERSRIGRRGELFQQALIIICQAAATLDQVRAVAHRAVQALGAAPKLDA